MRNVLVIALLAVTFAFAQPHEEHATKPVESAEQRLELEAEEEKPMPNEIWWKLANFAVLVGGLGYLFSKYAGPYFRARSEEIREGIRESAEVRAEAEARAASIESKLGDLSGEIESIRSAAKAEIASEAAHLQAETEVQITKIRRHGGNGNRLGDQACQRGFEGVLGATRAGIGREANSAAARSSCPGRLGRRVRK